MATFNDLQDAFVYELRDTLSAERQILKALPKMSKAASSSELKKAFEKHQKETQEHVQRVEKALESLEETVKAHECEGIKGLLKEGEEIMEAEAESEVSDALLISAAQKVEHYEISTYGTLCTWGEVLGLDEAVDFLKKNLDEEKVADEKLSKVAQKINAAA